MSPTRRDFLKYTGATSVLLASSDLVGQLLAQSPKGNPLTSTFKGLADVVLGEAKKAGCSYADVRFTRSVSSGVNATGGSDRNADGGGGFGGGRGGRGGAGRGGGARAGGRPGAAGFGVRVIHSGVWGFASSPIVTEDELRRITRIASEVAKASAVAKKTDVKLAPVPAYTEYWASPMVKDPTKISTEDKQAFVQKVVDLAAANKNVSNVTASVGVNNEWRYFASTEGSYIEQETFEITPTFNVSAKIGDVTKTRSFVGVPRTGVQAVHAVGQADQARAVHADG
jgi:TldD protein